MACLTSPTGQLQAILSLAALGEETVVLSAQVDPILKRVEEFVISEDVAVAQTGLQVVTIQGAGSWEFVQDRLEGLANLPAARLAAEGWDVLVERRASERALAGLEVISSDELDRAALERGVPAFGLDTSEKTLPPELGPHFEASTISYQKGCYVGQEVLMRVHSRGHVNRQWVGLNLSESVIRGADVLHEGKSVGQVHRVLESPEFGWIGSATLRSSATDPGTQVSIGGAMATVIEMPFRKDAGLPR